MVEVYKTNVHKMKISEKVISKFSKRFPALKVSFDLDDCDKIMRVEGENFCPLKVKNIVKRMGYKCKLLK